MTRDLFKLLTCSTVLAFLVGDTCVASQTIKDQTTGKLGRGMQEFLAGEQQRKARQAEAQKKAKQEREEAESLKKEEEERQRIEREEAERLKKEEEERQRIEEEIKKKKAEVIGLADQAGNDMHHYFVREREEGQLKKYNEHATALNGLLSDTGITWNAETDLQMSAYVIWYTFHIVHKDEKFARFINIHNSDERKEADRLTESIKKTAISVRAWPVKVENDCLRLLTGEKSDIGEERNAIEKIITENVTVEGNADNMRTAYGIEKK